MTSLDLEVKGQGHNRLSRWRRHPRRYWDVEVCILVIIMSWSPAESIQKQTRSPYARANMLKRRFSTASLHTKGVLFNAYCTPMYGCQLWNIAYRYNYDRLCVAFNDAFRLLLDVPRWTSAFSLCVLGLHRVPTFAAVIRKFAYTLYDCIRNSSNSLLIAYV